MRLDRLLTLRLFHPLRRLRPPTHPEVPVLMYHSISPTNGDRRRAYYEIRTSAQQFCAQMEFLHRSGFTSLSLSNPGVWWSAREAGRRGMVITFDDAYEDFLTDAFPILHRLGFKSMVYVPTDLVGKSGPTGIKLLDWGQICELRRMGVEFGSHTASHPDMKRLTREQRLRELSDSKKTLEDRLGERVKDFSHPYAFPEHDAAYVRQFRDLLLECGYSTAVTTIIGTVKQGDNPLQYKRLPVNEWDDLDLLRAKIEAGYNWLHTCQYFSKKARACLRAA